MKVQWVSKKWLIILLHVFAWLILFSLPYLLRPSYNTHEPAPKFNGRHIIYFSVIMDISWIVFFYLNSLVFIPNLVNKKKMVIYGLVLLISFTFFLFETSLISHVFLNGEIFNIRAHFLFTFFIFLFILASSTAYQMIIDRIRNERFIKEKETEFLKTELSFLRSQVSPHFMFNVLNNMVALARKQSDQLEPSLIKLSSLMRYMLYETDEQSVILSKEMEYLQSYIDLQQQRFGKKIQLNVLLHIPDKEYCIEPMLLIPFVENAFKHGTGVVENAQIDIELRVLNGSLHFLVKNKFNNKAEEYKDKTSGIGLNNVERRLQLLYKEDHTLKINKDHNWFTVSLLLNLH